MKNSSLKCISQVIIDREQPPNSSSGIIIKILFTSLTFESIIKGSQPKLAVIVRFLIICLQPPVMKLVNLSMIGN